MGARLESLGISGILDRATAIGSILEHQENPERKSTYDEDQYPQMPERNVYPVNECGAHVDP
jgi:hypothetical protein